MDRKKLKYLKRKAHEMKAELQIGQNGLSDDVLKEIEKRLEQKELIKLKLMKRFEENTKEAVEKILGTTGSELVQAIGGTIVLFKEKQTKGKENQAQAEKGLRRLK